MPRKADTYLKERFRPVSINRFEELFAKSGYEKQEDFFDTFQPTLTKSSYHKFVQKGGNVTRLIAEQALLSLGFDSNEISDMLMSAPNGGHAPIPLTTHNGPLILDSAQPVSTVASMHLPLPLTELIGREKDIAEVSALLERHRLVTLVGAGGMGKTRLALAVADAVQNRYANGARLIQLEALVDTSTSEQVASNVASALGLKEQPGQKITDTLVTSLSSLPLLLVLDNCEHLLKICAQLIQSLLSKCPNIRVLATSRQAFGPSWELPYHVPPLDVPPSPITAADVSRTKVAALMSYSAVRLFMKRVETPFAIQNVTTSRRLAIVKICRQLDGMPLAIEMAAARVGPMSVEEVCDRLSDRFSLLRGDLLALQRHETLGAVIDWSYELLSHDKQLLFNRLSVFAGGWSLEAAQYVGSGRGIDASQVHEILTSLVEASMVVAEANNAKTRYSFLETILAYAKIKLEQTEDVRAAKNRHQEFYALFAETIESQLEGEKQRDALAEVAAELPNLHLAMEWEAVERSLRIAGALCKFYEHRRHFSDGLTCISRLLGRPDSNVNLEMRAKACIHAGTLAKCLRSYTTAQDWLGEAMTIYTGLRNYAGVLEAEKRIANCLQLQGRYAKAKKQYADIQSKQLQRYVEIKLAVETATTPDEIVRLKDQLNERSKALAWTYVDQGCVALLMGHTTQAHKCYVKSLEVGSSLQFYDVIAQSHKGLGNCLQCRGDYEGAKIEYKLSIIMMHKKRDASEPLTMYDLACLKYYLGDYQSAHKMLNWCLERQERLQSQIGILYVQFSLGRVFHAVNKFPLAAKCYRYCLNLAASVACNDCEKAMIMEPIAALACSLNKHDCAASLWGKAERLRKRVGAPMPLNELAAYDRGVRTTREYLTHEGCDFSWRIGSGLSWDGAVALALREVLSETAG